MTVAIGCNIFPASFYVLALFLTYSSTSGLIYHIIPSPTDQCPTPTQPCYTLSQLISLDTDIYFRSNLNITLIFEPGAHHLNSTALKIEGLSSIRFMKSDIRSNVSIICDYSNIFLYNITFVHTRGVDFIGCSSKGELAGHIY